MRLFALLAIATVLAGCASGGPGGVGPEETKWTMLMVTPANDVADAHLLRLPGNLTVLIDAGKLGDAPGAVVNQLKAQQVSRLDLVVISHFHIDHYGALTEIVDAGIEVKRVAVNLPSQASADIEKPWGCDLAHVQSVLDYLRRHQIPYFTPAAGERVLETTTPRGTKVSLDVVCLYDGLNSPVGLTDVNGTSMIVRLSHGATRALFTGDLGHLLGDWLAKSSFDLKADLIKVPHHGAEGMPPDEFFDRVAPKAALVPAPKSLWESARAMRIRNYLNNQRIPTYVSALRGNVTATLTSEGFRIESEH